MSSMRLSLGLFFGATGRFLAGHRRTRRAAACPKSEPSSRPGPRPSFRPGTCSRRRRNRRMDRRTPAPLCAASRWASACACSTSRSLPGVALRSTSSVSTTTRPTPKSASSTARARGPFPRSTWRFFAGRSPERDVRALLVENPATGVLRATTAADGETWSIEPSPRGGRFADLMPQKARERRDGPGVKRSRAADRVTNVSTSPPASTSGLAKQLPRESSAAEALTSLHTATIAVDTDNELLSLKFANNTTAATNYIANLIAAMNVFYERDVNLRLLQGTTFLRVSTTADPYNQSGTGAADSAKLNEFGNYWAGGCNGRARRAARAGDDALGQAGEQQLGVRHRLAGRHSARTHRLQLQPGLQVRSGHLGQRRRHRRPRTRAQLRLAPHPLLPPPAPIDTCYNGEGGCYAGRHQLPGAADDQRRAQRARHGHELLPPRRMRLGRATVFHPRTLSEQINPHIEPRVGTCIFSGFQLSSLAPVSAPTARWDAGRPRGQRDDRSQLGHLRRYRGHHRRGDRDHGLGPGAGTRRGRRQRRAFEAGIERHADQRVLLRQRLGLERGSSP